MKMAKVNSEEATEKEFARISTQSPTGAQHMKTITQAVAETIDRIGSGVITAQSSTNGIPAMRQRSGQRSVNAKPLTVGDLIAILEDARREWGDATIPGISLSGSDYTMPILSCHVSRTRQRVTITANFSDSAQQHRADLTAPKQYPVKYVILHTRCYDGKCRRRHPQYRPAIKLLDWTDYSKKPTYCEHCRSQLCITGTSIDTRKEVQE